MVTEAYDFWLFDLDGTLIDTEWAYTREVFDRVGDRLGRQFSDQEAEILWHGLGGARDPQLRQWGIDPAEFWPIFHDEERPVVRAESTYLHPDAVDFMAEIERQDVPVGLVTHCQEFLTQPVLDHLDIGDWFDTVVCCTEELGWKPDPAPVSHAMSQMGVTAGQRGVLAGDGESDIGAAWNAGLDGIHVERHGPQRRGRCVLGDYRVDSFAPLLSDVATDGGTETR
ncbi:HAD family hydrolase [Halohasta litorea]|uniref:HAD family hydrolase n=1 Tax=Halohasta litorea TaxID=869891 RepID=A0ABD6D840_9EURY|nr:HAD family hydrolase [Halohasta litorea]MEA1931897.1 HAD family hydrolase [Euryarchaeota archaeon]